MLLRGALILLMLVCTVCPGESKNGVYLRCLQRCLFAKCVRENPGCINYCRWSCLKHLFRRNSVWEDDRYSSNSILFGAK